LARALLRSRRTRPDCNVDRRQLPRRRRLEIRVRILPLVPFAGAMLLCAVDGLAQDGDPKVGRNLAATCAACHGPGGVSVGDVESLAGKPREEIVRKMLEFKTGARPSTVMQQLAKGYTDEQIELLAGWYAKQKPAK
jgi:cytochrome subunit of sulfide dehydrogenase